MEFHFNELMIYNAQGQNRGCTFNPPGCLLFFLFLVIDVIPILFLIVPRHGYEFFASIYMKEYVL